MRRVLELSLILLLVFTSLVFARQQKTIKKHLGTDPIHNLLDSDSPLDLQGQQTSARADTFLLGQWSFDMAGYCDEMGWTRADLTAQTHCFWHIDDFIGLGGGTHGLLAAIEGYQSLWCGARPSPGDDVLCGYATLPGYGNNWDQSWVFRCIDVPVTEAVTISYRIKWDSEPGYDFMYVQYATKGSCDSLIHIDDIPFYDWIDLATYSGFSSTPVTAADVIPVGHFGSIKFRFHFVSDDAWSDQDGYVNTDGAVIIDSIVVEAPSGVYDYEDFEDEAPGDLATTDGDWECQTLTGFSADGVATYDGFFGDLYPGLTLVQEDPCITYLTCVWAFINGSTQTYACGGHPGQLSVPMVNIRGQYIREEIWSPKIPWTGYGNQALLGFDVYRDLRFERLAFYVWHVRSWIADCPGYWRDRDSFYYGPGKDWFTVREFIGDLIDPMASDIQISLGCWDMCDIWCGIVDFDGCHSHAPLFDNVRVYRIGTEGPLWSVRGVELFQDNFPEDGTATGTVRADMALDILPPLNPWIQPGDSACVTVDDPEVGLDIDYFTGQGPSAYCYVCVLPQDQPGKSGPGLVDDPARWPCVDSVLAGDWEWYQIRLDTVFNVFHGSRTGPVEDKFCVDLRDDLFEPGDTILYFFGARNNFGIWTYWSELCGTTQYIDQVAQNPMEFTCLPANAKYGLTDILYVDNFDEGGAQPYFDSAFELLGEKPDRYDVRGPAVAASNSPASRVTSLNQQLIPFYKKIIWNSGDLSEGTIASGDWVNKANDFELLYDFLDLHVAPTGVGIYLSGDDLAQEWADVSCFAADQLRSNYIPHNVITGDHAPLCGTSPLIVAEKGSIFDHEICIDAQVAFGGCPSRNDFDVLAPLEPSTIEMTYQCESDAAVIANDTLNSMGSRVRVVLSGFSYHYIRDDMPAEIPDRAHHLYDILWWFDGGVSSLSDDVTYLEDTWEWNGNDWFRLRPENSPPARFFGGGNGLAYDSVDANVVLFGGEAGTVLDDTWTWDGTDWTYRQAHYKPSPRWGHALATGPNGRVVLFGGNSALSFENDTWEYTLWFGLKEWILKNPLTSPPPRRAHAMAYNPAMQVLVLFGGWQEGGPALGDFWIMQDWEWQQSMLPGPPARFGHAMASHPDGDFIILFGGIEDKNGGYGPFLADTWLWNGLMWQDYTMPESPPARGFSQMVWDEGLSTFIIFGGLDSNQELLDDMWAWSLLHWTQISSDHSPSPRYGHGMAYDPDRQRVVLFGGLGHKCPAIPVCEGGLPPTEAVTTPVFMNELVQNYPNPFNPITTIKYSLKERAHVTITIYDVAGRLVKNLIDGVKAPGVYTDLKWDGTNTRGEKVSSGVYFCRLKTKGYVKTHKLLLLK